MHSCYKSKEDNTVTYIFNKMQDFRGYFYPSYIGLILFSL